MTATHYCYHSGQVVTILYCIGPLLLRLRVTILYCIGLRRAYTVSSRGHDCHSLLLLLGVQKVTTTLYCMIVSSSVLRTSSVQLVLSDASCLLTTRARQGAADE